MNIYFRTVNAFVEDTCVIIVVAYLLARGPMLALLFQQRLSRRHALTLGLILGLIGLTETIFPGARYPYVTSTLIVTFASITAGLQVGLVTAGVVTLVALLLQPLQIHLVGQETVLPIVISVLLGSGLRRAIRSPITPLKGMGIGICAQTTVVMTGFLFARFGTLHYDLQHALFSIPANGFGQMLLLLVVQDAQMRADSIRHREEAERAQALIAEAQLGALRARIRPHFLFNALTSIAALCNIAPERAEAAIVRLSQQMRRVLSFDPAAPVCLREEIEQVTAYLEIEQLRLGERLKVCWEIDPACAYLMVPAFALQTLVENAVTHGIAPGLEPGSVRIIARKYPGHALIAVADDGIGLPLGMQLQSRREAEAGGARQHGLQILAQQLILQHGRRARLRLLSRKDRGVIAAFTLPCLDEPVLHPKVAA